MGAGPEQDDAVHKPPVAKRPTPVLRILAVVIFVLFLAAVWIPHNLVSRVALDEISAVKNLRTLNSLQLAYAKTHASKGFTCEPAQLKAQTLAPNEESFPKEFSGTGSYEGYKYSLMACEVDPKEVVIHYKASAVPVVQDKTGYRTFCTDESGVLWYDMNGSVENCLTERRPI